MAVIGTWLSQAVGTGLACGTNPDLFFAESPQDVARAKELCAGCPVRAQCLAGALDRGEPWGVWGGQLLLRGAVVHTKRARGRRVSPSSPPEAGPSGQVTWAGSAEKSSYSRLVRNTAGGVYGVPDIGVTGSDGDRAQPEPVGRTEVADDPRLSGPGRAAMPADGTGRRASPGGPGRAATRPPARAGQPGVGQLDQVLGQRVPFSRSRSMPASAGSRAPSSTAPYPRVRGTGKEAVDPGHRVVRSAHRELVALPEPAPDRLAQLRSADPRVTYRKAGAPGPPFRCLYVQPTARSSRAGPRGTGTEPAECDRSHSTSAPASCARR